MTLDMCYAKPRYFSILPYTLNSSTSNAMLGLTITIEEFYVATWGMLDVDLHYDDVYLCNRTLVSDSRKINLVTE